MSYNVDLMLAIREQITTHPETHDQDSWGNKTAGCGTTHCIAGWAGALSRAQLDWSGADESWMKLDSIDGQDPEIFGEKALGLTRAEAGALFYAGEEGALALLDRMIEAGKNGERIRGQL